MFLLAVSQIQNNDKLVADMQDKLIEIQQHEIEFLNNFVTHLGWIFGLVVSVIGIIALYIGNANRQAKIKMDEAEKVLGEAKVVRDALIQDKADLATYREETRREFAELIALVNSEEIEKIKHDTKLLMNKNEVKMLLDRIEGYINNGENTVQRIKETGGNIEIQEIKEFIDCQQKFNYLKLYRRQPLNDAWKAEHISFQCKELEEKSYEAVVALGKAWENHFEKNLSDQKQ